VQIVNNYLTKNPKLEEWVNETDIHDIRSTGITRPANQPPRRRPTFKLPFRRP